MNRLASVVAVAAFVGMAAGSPSFADDDPATASGYRLYRTAIAVYDSRGQFEVFVRLNRALPVSRGDGKSPRIGGSIRLEGIHGFTGVGGAGGRDRHCYTATVDIEDPDLHPPPVLRRPREGRKARVAVGIRDVRRSLRTRAELVPASKAGDRPHQRLGC